MRLAHELHEGRQVASSRSRRRMRQPRSRRAVPALGEELVHEVRLPGARALLHQRLRPSGYIRGPLPQCSPYPRPHLDSLGLRLEHECDELALVPSHVSQGSARARWLAHQAPTKPPRRHHLYAELTGLT